MKHSPAPWRIGKKQERAILDANGSQIAVLPESLKPDAALIAAAPEMLKQLKAAIEFLDKYWGTTATYQLIEDYEEYHAIRSVIAKAEGNVPTQTETK